MASRVGRVRTVRHHDRAQPVRDGDQRLGDRAHVAVAGCDKDPRHRQAQRRSLQQRVNSGVVRPVRGARHGGCRRVAEVGVAGQHGLVRGDAARGDPRHRGGVRGERVVRPELVGLPDAAGEAGGRDGRHDRVRHPARGQHRRHERGRGGGTVDRVDHLRVGRRDVARVVGGQRHRDRLPRHGHREFGVVRTGVHEGDRDVVAGRAGLGGGHRDLGVARADAHGRGHCTDRLEDDVGELRVGAPRAELERVADEGVGLLRDRRPLERVDDHDLSAGLIEDARERARDGALRAELLRRLPPRAGDQRRCLRRPRPRGPDQADHSGRDLADRARAGIPLENLDAVQEGR